VSSFSFHTCTDSSFIYKLTLPKVQALKDWCQLHLLNNYLRASCMFLMIVLDDLRHRQSRCPACWKCQSYN
jgi:hypothetical protein